jgi:L-asparaginase
MTHVHLIALGGTIASHAEAGKGVTPKLGAAEILESAAGFIGDFTVSTAQLAQTASPNLDLAQVVAVGRHAAREISAGAAGVVVTQGTDCIEETSFVLDITNPTDRPVVVTGAMRNPTLAGPDGPANVSHAVRAAAAPCLKGLGAVVVFNEELHDPWMVRKTHTANPATFSSGPSAGPIGWITENRVRLVHRPEPAPRIALEPGVSIPPVAFLSLTLGDDLRLIRHVEEAGYRALVLDAFGGGHVPEALRPTVQQLAKRMPVVFGSRTGAGETLSRTYDFPGSEMDLLALGCISSGVLTSRKARIVLSLLMAALPADPLRRWDEFANRYG